MIPGQVRPAVLSIQWGPYSMCWCVCCIGSHIFNPPPRPRMSPFFFLWKRIFGFPRKKRKIHWGMRERQYRPTTSDLLDGILVFVHNVKDFLHFFPPFSPFFTIHRRKGAHLGWTAGQFGATWDSFNKTDEELRFSLYFCASTHGTLCVSSSNLLLSEWDRFSSSSSLS